MNNSNSSAKPLPHVCIIAPIGDTVQGPTHVSVVNTILNYVSQGGTMTHANSWLSSNIADTRRQLFRNAYDTGADRFVFVDSDIVFTPEQFQALVTTEEDVVSGMYLTRTPGGSIAGKPIRNPEERGPLLEVATVPLGFVSISRDAMKKLLEKYGDGLFQFKLDGTRVTSECESFSQAWRDLGGKLWLHRGIRLGHVGPMVFEFPADATQGPVEESASE